MESIRLGSRYKPANGTSGEDMVEITTYVGNKHQSFLYGSSYVMAVVCEQIACFLRIVFVTYSSFVIRVRTGLTRCNLENVNHRTQDLGCTSCLGLSSIDLWTITEGCPRGLVHQTVQIYNKHFGRALKRSDTCTSFRLRMRQMYVVRNIVQNK